MRHDIHEWSRRLAFLSTQGGNDGIIQPIMHGAVLSAALSTTPAHTRGYTVKNCPLQDASSVLLMGSSFAVAMGMRQSVDGLPVRMNYASCCHELFSNTHLDANDGNPFVIGDDTPSHSKAFHHNGLFTGAW